MCTERNDWGIQICSKRVDRPRCDDVVVYAKRKNETLSLPRNYE